ncbi:uncharacterized protein LOC132751651 [Ruditapes philippinarum]|uniref:uncharacterized protein LOC132751651 n=1 Tax=Ruditapes philippinarum TaxID=129788 RepID=UPI00295BE007|nr:uncharacterized protein LOC132751651 [Ruditapes philippinarum]
MPQNIGDWLLLAKDFKELWNFPHCVGAIDGKHIVVRAPRNTGSLHFNYKGTFSIVLMALVDANLQFTMIDIGSYGRNSDGGVFAHSKFGTALSCNQLHLPLACVMPGAEELGPMPYVILGDEAFPLQEHIMRPYPGRGHNFAEQIFNYRLSRARRIVESAFGILAARWRVFYTKICVSVSTTKAIVKAAIVLHNLLQRETTVAQTATLLEDNQANTTDGFCPLVGVGNRGSEHAIAIREKFKKYFTRFDTLLWQDVHVRWDCFGGSQ